MSRVLKLACYLFGLFLALLIIYVRIDSHPLMLAYVGNITGTNSELGIAGRDGAILAVEEYNAHRGLLGRRVQLFIGDDKSNGDVVRRIDKQIVDKGVRVIVGHMTSSMSISAVQAFKDEDVVFISPTTSSNELTGILDNFIRLYPPSQEMAKKLAQTAYSMLGLRKVYILSDDSNKGHTLGWSRYFRSEFVKLGGVVVGAVAFSSSTQLSYSEIVGDIISKHADSVLVLSNPLDAASICQELYKQAVHNYPKVLLSEWSTTGDLIELGGNAVEGVYFMQTFDSYSKEPGFVAFQKKYRKRFRKNPSFASVHSYDATRLALDVLCRTRKDKITSSDFSSREFRGIQQKIKIDKYGDLMGKLYLSTIRHGRYRVLKNEKE